MPCIAAQGAALSLYTGYSSAHALGGVAVLSGYLPLASGFGARLHAANRSTPAFVAHGSADQVVALSWARQSVQVLKANHIPLTYTEYPRLPHSISRQEISDLAAWLRPLLAPSAPL